MTNRRRKGKQRKDPNRHQAAVRAAVESVGPPPKVTRAKISQVAFFVKRALGRHGGIEIQ